jgi:nonribosomal peptide synthetase protein VioO
VVGVPALHEPRTVVDLLATWAAGGSYCPIDPAYPAGHAGALLAALDGHELDDAAYVLFTSGSTGRPKPVAVPHRALDVVVPALVDLFAITAEDRVLQFASLSWDTSFEELLPTLAAGATVVFGRDAHVGSLPRFLRLVERRGVTVLDLPTAVWHELVLHLAEAGHGLPACVRLVVVGGEAVDERRLAAWHSLPGVDSIRLLNTYGATETALITHAADLRGSSAPIGRPLDHVVQLVSDEQELLVGLPDATAERFVYHDGRRWFRSGDLVRFGADGLLHHAGRLDAQVKVRGVRVDPGEVEAHLRRHPHVAAAAVTGVSLSDRTVLAAYVVPDGAPPRHGRRDLVADIRAFLRARTPGHLWPSRITVVPELALTRSGKVDRRATHERYHLPSPDKHAQEATR